MSSSAATVGSGSASDPTAPYSRAHAMTACSAGSPYLTRTHLVPGPLSPIFLAPAGGYHLRYAGDRGVSLSRDHQLVRVALVRKNGSSALAGRHLVDMLRGSANFSVDEHLVENGLQQIPLAGTAALEPGDLIGTSSCPLLRVPAASALHRDDSASTRYLDTPDEPYMVVPGPVASPSAGISAPPTCSDPFVHLVNETPLRGGPGPTRIPSANREPQPSLLERLDPGQRINFL